MVIFFVLLNDTSFGTLSVMGLFVFSKNLSKKYESNVLEHSQVSVYTIK